jgi:hypothetical protein
LFASLASFALLVLSLALMASTLQTKSNIDLPPASASASAPSWLTWLPLPPAGLPENKTSSYGYFLTLPLSVI